jgi:hypothetical protein
MLGQDLPLWDWYDTPNSIKWFLSPVTYRFLIKLDFDNSQATIFCDILVLKCMKNRTYYQDKKYLVIRGPDAFDVDPSERNANQYSRFGGGISDTENPVNNENRSITD